MSKILRGSTLAALLLTVFVIATACSVAAAEPQEPTNSAPVVSSAEPAVPAPSASGMFTLLSYLVPLLGICGLVFTFWKSQWVSKQEVGTEKMAKIAKHISDGAMSFLKAEYSILLVFVIVVAALLGWADTLKAKPHRP